MKIYMLCTIAIQIVLLSNLAKAGNESHGGNVVKCPLKESVVLDYYHSQLPTLGGQTPVLKNISAMTTDETIQFILSRFEGMPFQNQIKDALSKLGPVSNWLSADLKNTSDSNEPYILPQGCEMLQAAVRQDQTMFVDPNVVQEISPAQLGVLVMHEAMFYFGEKAAGLTTSEKIRTLMREVLKDSPSIRAIQSAIVDIDGAIYKFQLLKNKTYVAHPNNYQIFQMQFFNSGAANRTLDAVYSEKPKGNNQSLQYSWLCSDISELKCVNQTPGLKPMSLIISPDLKTIREVYEPNPREWDETYNLQ